MVVFVAATQFAGFGVPAKSSSSCGVPVMSTASLKVTVASMAELMPLGGAEVRATDDTSGPSAVSARQAASPLAQVGPGVVAHI